MFSFAMEDYIKTSLIWKDISNSCLQILLLLLKMEIEYLQRKYEDDWMKYYPYHLDPAYDDENGNPHDYGLGADDEEEDNWWKK